MLNKQLLTTCRTKFAAYSDPATGKAGPYSGMAAANVAGLDKQLANMSRNRQSHPGQYYLNPFVPGPLTELFARSNQRQIATVGESYGGLGAVAAGNAVGGGLGGIAGDSLGTVIGSELGGRLGEAMGRAGGSQAGGEAGSQLAGSDDVKTQARDAHVKTNQPYSDASDDAAEVAASGEPVGEPLTGAFDTTQGANVAGMDELISGMSRNRHENPGNYWLNPMVPGPISEGLARYGRRVAAGSHGSLLSTLLGVPTLGLVPAIRGGAAAKEHARATYKSQSQKYEDGPEEAKQPSKDKAKQDGLKKEKTEKAASVLRYLLSGV